MIRTGCWRHRTAFAGSLSRGVAGTTYQNLDCTLPRRPIEDCLFVPVGNEKTRNERDTQRVSA